MPRLCRRAVKAPRGQAHAIIGPEPAQAATEVGKDGRDIEMTKERKSDDVVDDEQLAQLAFALLPGAAGRQQFTDHLSRIAVLEHLHIEERWSRSEEHT